MLLAYAYGAMFVGIVLVAVLVALAFVVLPQVFPDLAPKRGDRSDSPSPRADTGLGQVPVTTQPLPVRLVKWHLAAAIFAAGPPLLWGIRTIYAALGSPGCDGRILYGCVADGLFAEMAMWSLVGSIPVAILYLDRLMRAGRPNAEWLAFGIWLVPRSAFGLIGDAVTPWAIIVAVGLAVYLASLKFRLPIALRAASVIALLMPLAGSVAAGVSLGLLDASVSALAIGYGIYRLSWKYGLAVRFDSTESRAMTGRVDHGLARVLVCGVAVTTVPIFWLVYATMPESLTDVPLVDPAIIVATTGVTLSAGAGTFAFMLARRLGDERDATECARVVFVVSLTFAAVFNLRGMPPLVDATGSTDSFTALTLIPTFAWLAAVGAGLMLLTTLTRWMLQLRPLCLGMIAFAWIYLPVSEINLWEGDASWASLPAWCVAAALTCGILALMWYAFGPGNSWMTALGATPKPLESRAEESQASL